MESGQLSKLNRTLVMCARGPNIENVTRLLNNTIPARGTTKKDNGIELNQLRDRMRTGRVRVVYCCCFAAFFHGNQRIVE